MRKEIELLARVQECGSVVHLHGVYESESHIYIVMELCLGGDLERILEVSWAQAPTLAWEAACISSVGLPEGALLGCCLPGWPAWWQPQACFGLLQGGRR